MYKVIGNFTNGDGSFKKGSLFNGKDSVENLLKAGLIEPLKEEVAEAKDIEVKKPKSKKEKSE